MRNEPQLTQEWWDRRTAPEPNSGCLLWTWGTDPDGYGITYVNKRQVRANRVAYEQVHGPLGDGMWALHHCDNPFCVNPEHLFAGTSLDNARDRDAKGRTARGDRSGTRKYPEKVRRGLDHPCHGIPGWKQGAKNGRAILSEGDAIQAIARIHAGESCASIARSFGVSDVAIGLIKSGRNWRHLSRPWADA